MSIKVTYKDKDERSTPIPWTPPCHCGNPKGMWRSVGSDTRREYLCDTCAEREDIF